MYTTADRSEIRDALIARPRSDAFVVAAAVVGSGASGHEDAWSDIDLALLLADGVAMHEAVESWTQHISEALRPVDHLDLW